MNMGIFIRERVGGMSAMLCACCCLTACATSGSYDATPPQPRAFTPALSAEMAAENDFGIQVHALRLSAGGFMLDLRYRVVDPERARTLLDRRVPAYLVDEASGARLGVPNSAKLGKLRQGTLTSIQTNRDYGMLFGNPGRYLKPGAKVTLVAGDIHMPNLTVQ